MRRAKDTKLTKIDAILPGIVNPAEAAKARIAAILDRQARGNETVRSIERLKREELMDDPWGPEVGV